jgi:hypothetical protein
VGVVGMEVGAGVGEVAGVVEGVEGPEGGGQVDRRRVGVGEAHGFLPL